MTRTVAPSKAEQKAPYEVLAEILDFSTKDHESWWHNGAPVLGNLMKWANYSLEAQYRHLVFFYKHLSSFLGPYSPQPMFWQSNITSTGLPLEFSVNFRRGALPTIRLSIEPVSHLAGTTRDPFNQLEMWRFMNSMSRLEAGFDSELFNHFMANLTLSKSDWVRVKDQQAPSFPLQGQANMGMDLKHTGEGALKAYVLPSYKAKISGIPSSDLVFGEIRRLKDQIDCSRSLSVLKEYIDESNLQKNLNLFGWDCTDIVDSRLKIYFVEPECTFRKAEALYTLNGRLGDETTKKGVELIRELWDLLSFSDSESEASSRAPLMCSYELRQGDEVPSPKLYIHLRDLNDMDSARAFTTFFERHGCTDQEHPYHDILSVVSPNENPDETVHLQSCIAFSYTEKTGVYASVYYLHIAGEQVKGADFWAKMRKIEGQQQ